MLSIFKILITYTYIYISKVGVCKVFAEGGLLSGFLSIRFIVVALACLCTLHAKFWLSIMIFSERENFPFSFPLLTLPGLITGVTFTWHRALFKTFLRHPSILLLPMVSFFTFESNTKKCCQKKDNLKDEVKIRFSVKATFFNILFTLVILIVIPFIAIAIRLETAECPLWTVGGSALDCSLLLIKFNTLFFLPAILSTAIFLFCCSCPKYCSCTSFPSCFPPLEFGVYKPSSPDKLFVIDQWSKEVKEVEEFALGEDQTASRERGAPRGGIKMLGMGENTV